ncbi:RHS repeat-associated core domain-containing protein [Pseudomonas carassii]|uniref:RHS repeat-associated core domain-containing protein n=1 Tax=Pseudomonas carassii TaxID=3115855 RepID=A0ABU7H7I4_9PSED|nr:RHS repeat-associated core domain-containing protein [Pseudomonas sp. 137P]MEE1887181.1 RHS repeat-associated core domain-containing protein [Pseudomonas sp. 137P]
MATQTLLASDRLQSPCLAKGRAESLAAAYTPYGQRSPASFPAALGFTGQRFEQALDGYVLGSYRVYSVGLMRFLSADSWSPFGGGGLNAYAYCAGDPVNQRDTNGHMMMTFNAAAPYVGGVSNLAIGSWVMLGGTPTTNFDVQVARGMSLGAWGGLGVKIAKQAVPEGPAKVALTVAEVALTAIGAGFSGARSIKAIKNSGKDSWARVKKNMGVIISGLPTTPAEPVTPLNTMNNHAILQIESNAPTSLPDGLRRRGRGSSRDSESDLSTTLPGTPPSTPFAMGGVFDLDEMKTILRKDSNHQHSD